MKASFVVLPGDGIGPEVTAEAVRALQAVAARCGHEFRFSERLMGGCSIDAHGTALTDEVLAACRACRRRAARRGRRAEVGRPAGEGAAGAGAARRCARASASSRTCGR